MILVTLTCKTCHRPITEGEWATYVGTANMIDGLAFEVTFECGCAGQEPGVWLSYKRLPVTEEP